jgi:ABC-type transport system substrate-binding protein
VAQAWTAAQDRFFMGDTVYLGDYKLSALNATPWFNEFWSISQEELFEIPGWRPDREADITEARLLLDASGHDRDFDIMMPDLWEATYPGITESSKAMYENALGRIVNVDIQPYTVILQRLEEHTHPGSGPAWGNPPTDLDPTTPMRDVYIPGSPRNFYGYDFQPVTDLLDQMTVTLDIDDRKELGLRVQRILLGTDAEHGSSGFGPRIGTMNGIQRNVAYPYVNRTEDVFQFAHASHHLAAAWMDTTHPDYPA